MTAPKTLRVRERFLPFAAPLVGQEEVDAVTECVRSGWLTTGFKVKEFEKAFTCKPGQPMVPGNRCRVW